MHNIENILNKVLESDYRLTVDDAAVLFAADKQKDVELIKKAADTLRINSVGNEVSYIINLNANFTNICEAVCLFCGFRRNENDPESYVLNLDEFEEDLANAVKSGATEVCLQGGLYTKLQIPGLKSKNLLHQYAELLSWVKDKQPDIHIHAYSPEEIEFSSVMSGKSVKYVLEYFKDSGLDSIPGTAAEILVDEIRKKVCPKKLDTQKWVDVVKQAHRTGIPTTATIMYGHLETNYHRAQHLKVIRDIQDETKGITEFIPLPLIPNKTLLSKEVTYLTSLDRLKMLAIARLFFKNSINNIQASWVKQGIAETAESLHWGVNDIGGTLGDEKITYAAGGNFGRGISQEELVNIIKSQDRVPVLRDTLYNRIKEPVAR